MKKPNTGGAVLLKTKGKDYFRKLVKKRWDPWNKHKAELKQCSKLKKTKKMKIQKT